MKIFTVVSFLSAFLHAVHAYPQHVAIARSRLETASHVPLANNHGQKHPGEVFGFIDVSTLMANLTIGLRYRWIGAVAGVGNALSPTSHALAPDLEAYLTFGGPLRHPGYELLFHAGIGHTMEENATSLRTLFLLNGSHPISPYALVSAFWSPDSWNHARASEWTMRVRGGTTISAGMIQFTGYVQVENQSFDPDRTSFSPGVIACIRTPAF